MRPPNRARKAGADQLHEAGEDHQVGCVRRDRVGERGVPGRPARRSRRPGARRSGRRPARRAPGPRCRRGRRRRRPPRRRTPGRAAASSRAWRLVPAPETRTTTRNGVSGTAGSLGGAAGKTRASPDHGSAVVKSMLNRPRPPTRGRQCRTGRTSAPSHFGQSAPVPPAYVAWSGRPIPGRYRTRTRRSDGSLYPRRAVVASMTRRGVKTALPGGYTHQKGQPPWPSPPCSRGPLRPSPPRPSSPAC